jgi:uncharacterized protein (TIGR04255 family)
VNLPKKISPCPILEAVIELRFKSKVPSVAIFGILYNRLKDRYTNYEELPILELPRSVLETDSKLRFQPHYRFLNGDFIIQLGPQMISISVRENYPGWTVFLSEINYIVSLLDELNIIEKVNRLGMRYIDFFAEIDIFNNINLELTLNKEPLKSISKYVRTEFIKDDFKILLQITDNSEIKSKESNVTKGSLIDYDLSIESNIADFFKVYNDMLNKAHQTLKEHFFSVLIKKDFLKTLNPEY